MFIFKRAFYSKLNENKRHSRKIQLDVAVTSRWVDNVIVITSYNNDNSDSNNEWLMLIVIAVFLLHCRAMRRFIVFISSKLQYASQFNVQIRFGAEHSLYNFLNDYLFIR